MASRGLFKALGGLEGLGVWPRALEFEGPGSMWQPPLNPRLGSFRVYVTPPDLTLTLDLRVCVAAFGVGAWLKGLKKAGFRFRVLGALSQRRLSSSSFGALKASRTTRDQFFAGVWTAGNSCVSRRRQYIQVYSHVHALVCGMQACKHR